ncbi:hypothetical protein LRS10_22040 [Phenylobacterium sp. J426]|uniref:hypothetical protein n=1 Tax=Phenylobacterium sp. J426 TaxID=2898439 RepID=UPI0021514B0F|nr:hypothetical protein [Phenylobacterium sp. J426]MCR5876592.1 hypothetical protein [Phenylobacterium sp. J426]
MSRIAKRFELDNFARVTDGDKDDARRPDLTFIMSDPTFSGPYVINVVELKSPSLPLSAEHLEQLDEYIFQINEWCEAELSHKVNVRGFLIGAMPDQATTATGQKRLLKEFREQGANATIRIMSIQELLKDAWQVHIEAIKVLESATDEEEDEEEDDGDEAAGLDSGDGPGAPAAAEAANEDAQADPQAAEG